MTLRENETKEIVSDLSYSVDNQDMMRITRIEAECRHGKELLKNAGVRLRLKNELSFLKLIEPTPQGSDVLKLNIDMITGVTTKKKRRIFQGILKKRNSSPAGSFMFFGMLKRTQKAGS